MKIFSFIPLMAIAFVGCKGLKKDAIRDFIPGIYVKPISGEYATGSDTLVFSVLDDGANSYRIENRKGLQRIVDGQVLPPEYKTEKWTGIYNTDTKQVLEQRKGKLFSFLPAEGKLLMGGSEYEKVK